MGYEAQCVCDMEAVWAESVEPGESSGLAPALTAAC